jgi:hypothetical protein
VSLRPIRFGTSDLKAGFGGNSMVLWLQFGKNIQPTFFYMLRLEVQATDSVIKLTTNKYMSNYVSVSRLI